MGGSGAGGLTRRLLLAEVRDAIHVRTKADHAVVEIVVAGFEDFVEHSLHSTAAKVFVVVALSSGMVLMDAAAPG